ncbi:MAG: zinc metallopeptidase [Erysipelotrichia bacterium]|jgi:Zn-dependent membrane protease YugP|nr:zinc metallopeptidase [Erysipelotrichia bacterium]
MDLILYFAAIAIALWAQASVKNVYNRFSRVAANTRLTGFDVAQLIMRRQGVSDVSVEMTQSLLGDHYDPRSKTVRLSPNVYNSNSIASVAIAAHEVGHVLQDHEGYAFLKLRNSMLPLAIVSGNLAWFVIIIGFFASSLNIIYVGLLMLGVIAAFQLVTLPLEYDASARANRLLVEEGIVGYEDMPYVKKMLNAAALTYVAALATTLLQIARILLLTQRRR